jgi:anaerobic magnesium-protoporphyrin IX monomethyl ester cyclase
MKILFAVHDLSFADHIAISYLSAVAKQLGHTTYFCTLTKEKFCKHDLLASISVIKPDIVAYSINVVGFQRAVELNKKAKELHQFISILGGPQATFSPDTFFNSNMDVYCVGEGEYAFRDFLTCIEKNESFDDVITKNSINPVRPLIDLTELPPADRDLILSNTELSKLPKKTFYTSRGCPFQCAYCCNDLYHNIYRGKGAFVRRFSVETVINEIEHVKSKYRTDFIKFGDDCFAIRVDDWLLEFCDIYSSKIKIPFNCYLRLDTVTDDMLYELKKAGCYSVHLSVDSTSSYVRENILKRKMRTENLVDKLKLISSYGINTWVNYMLAVPESTLQDDLDAIKMSREGKVTYASYTTTVPMPGTTLYKYMVDHNYIDTSNYQGDMNGCSEPSVLTCFSKKEKDIRFNIYLLGNLISKLPKPLENIFIHLIKFIPPNKLFAFIRNMLYKHAIENKIFKLR